MNSVFPFPAATKVGDVPCYHPDVAGAQEDFPAEAFDRLVRVEDGHFWFESRNVILRELISHYLPDHGQTRRFLEIGCGTGFVLRMIASLPHIQAAGAEVHVEGARLAAPRVPQAEVVQLDALRMNFPGSFDAIGLFDVIEHLEDDITALTKVREALTPEGLCFISVPQHQWLWSPQDDMAGHKRRYTRAMLTDHVRKAGMEPVWMTSFCFALMPVFALSRFQKQSLSEDEAKAAMMSEVHLPDWQNKILRALLRLDESLIKRGVSLPFGGSLVMVARPARSAQA
jgi:SAM-dependent methyltransferase